MSDNLCYYNVFGNFEPNDSIKNYREILLKEQYIRLNKNTKIRYNNEPKKCKGE